MKEEVRRKKLNQEEHERLQNQEEYHRETFYDDLHQIKKLKKAFNEVKRLNKLELAAELSSMND